MTYPYELRVGAILRSSDPRDNGREVVLKAKPWHMDNNPMRTYQIRNRETGRVTSVSYRTLRRSYVHTGTFEDVA